MFLKYRKSDGHVVETIEALPVVREADMGYAETDQFNLGDEINYCIHVIEVNENNQVTRSNWYLHGEAIRRILNENTAFKAENADLKGQLAQTNADMQGLMDYLSQQGVL